MGGGVTARTGRQNACWPTKSIAPSPGSRSSAAATSVGDRPVIVLSSRSSTEESIRDRTNASAGLSGSDMMSHPGSGRGIRDMVKGDSESIPIPRANVDVDVDVDVDDFVH